MDQPFVDLIEHNYPEPNYNRKMHDIELSLVTHNHISQDIPKITEHNYYLAQPDDDENRYRAIVDDKYMIKSRPHVDVYQQDDDVKKFNPILHEAIIGILGMENFTSPNFAKVLAVQINKDGADRVMYEYIPGITFSEYLDNNPTGGEIRYILSQVFEALYAAYNKIDFTHYSLDTSNIIITDNDVPVITDYTTAHCMILSYRGRIQNFGYYNKSLHIDNQSQWIYDVFGLLIEIYQRIHPDLRRKYIVAHYEAQIADLYTDQSTDYDAIEELERIRDDENNPLYGERPSDELADDIADLLNFFISNQITVDFIEDYIEFIGMVPSKEMFRHNYNFNLFMEEVRGKWGYGEWET